MKKYIISILLLSSVLIPTAYADIVQVDMMLPPPPANCVSIDRNLHLGSNDKVSLNGQVAVLQNFLSTEGMYSHKVTGYFGSITLRAVKAYQKAHGISATGFVGVITRAMINTCSTTPVSSLNITSPKGGETWLQGTTHNIVWTDRNVYIQAQKYDISISPKSPCVAQKPCTMMAIKPYAIVSGTSLPVGGFVWNVGTITDAGRTLVDGEYNINVCAAGGGTCVQSNIIAVVTSIEGTTTSKVSALSPTSGSIGQQVTLVGQNFASTNTVNFGYGVIPNASSTNSTSITFTVPNQLNPACYYATPVHCMVMTQVTPPGTYNVSVTNAGGTSNAISFVVTQ